MLKYVIIFLLAIVAITLSIFGVRGMTSHRPPVVLFGDMDNQPKYKSQAESPFFPDGRTMRPTPPGAMPWGRRAESPSPQLIVDDQAAYALKKMPVKLDAALLTRGQQVYNTYCTVCHGAAGLGNGVTTQYNMSQPANYHIDRLRQETDGYFYKVITEGKGLMGGYGPSIHPADRWAVVAYVRALQRSENATMKDVPEAMRKELEQAK